MWSLWVVMVVVWSYVSQSRHWITFFSPLAPGFLIQAHELILERALIFELKKFSKTFHDFMVYYIVIL